ncbi:hypothetical protein NLJ89_g9371 [Agrocybe chaxingu]|uniref:3-carboxymuconate cyclase n=1 Tax=Agrocybe chaxingu TaxID=84603 RepID=A0A9W8MPX7_9AGAR|nr:hypothetical protein NLJ89_g9371 [Agrocybe chaxingu]
MKLLVSFATLAATVAAVPMFSSRGAASQTAGAAYFITNEDKNFVVVNRILPDGSVKLAGAISTRGRGAAGAMEAPGPDPLFTQDAVKVGGNNLFTINAGSNTVVMFSIDAADPTRLKMVGNPVSTGGEFPVSVAFSAARNMACVVNGGAVTNVNCYKPDAELGLVAIRGTNRPLTLPALQTTPPSGPAGTVSDIIFSEDSSKLLVSVKGVPPAPGFLASWDVAENGTLSEDFVSSKPAEGGLLPFSLTLVNGKNALLATDAGVGFETFDLSTLNGASSAPAKSQVVPIEGQGATCWSNFSNKTGTYFLTDIITSIVTEVDVLGDLSGSIVKQYPLAPGSATIDNAIAALPTNDFLYVLSPNATAIDVMALNGPGQATSVGRFDFGAVAAKLNLPVSPNRLQGMAVFVKSA